jgi:hypothetical protein
MPNINDEGLAPISFLKGGLYANGQVHLEGTFDYVPTEMADMTPEEQIDAYGDVYYEKGIRPGFPPGSESYLAPANQKRIRADRQAGIRMRREQAEGEDENAAAAAVSRAFAGKTGAQRSQNTGAEASPQDTITTMGVGAEPGPSETVSGLPPASHASAASAGHDEHTAKITQEGQPTATIEANLGEAAGESTEEGSKPSTEESNPSTVEPTPIEVPFEGADGMNIEQTKERLATADDETIDKFILWERSRPHPRVTLLRELEA